MNAARTMPNNESASAQATIDVDLIIDAFEKDIARNGIQAVDVRAHGSPFLSDTNAELGKQAAIELLRMGTEGEVLKPKQLRKRVADTVRALAQIY